MCNALARYNYKLLGNDKGKKGENEMGGNSLSTPSPLAGKCLKGLFST